MSSDNVPQSKAFDESQFQIALLSCRKQGT